jgi:hypothetical protein
MLLSGHGMARKTTSEECILVAQAADPIVGNGRYNNPDPVMRLAKL